MRIEIGDKKIFSKCLNEVLKTNIDHGKLNGLTFDSREIQKGDIFIAFPGDKTDGHDYIQDSIKKGAVLVINEIFKEKIIVKVKSSRQILGELSKLYRSLMSCEVIGITGSNGKTTTKELLVHILEGAFQISYTQGNYNSTIGAPMSIFSIKGSDELFIAEIGTNNIGEIEYISKIVQPNMAVITNIAESHLLNLHSLEGVYKEKENIFKSLPIGGKAFINMDDPFLSSTESDNRYTSIYYGFSENLDYSAKIQTEKQNIITINDDTINIPENINIHLQNVLSTFTICSELGIATDLFSDRLNTFKIPEGRGELIKINDFIVINDTYNANFSSVVSGLTMLADMSKGSRTFVVLGDMLELGKNEKELHKNLIVHIRDKNFFQVLIYGTLMYELYTEIRKEGLKTKVKYYNNQKEIISDLKNTLRSSDIIYVKGSRGMRMENIIKGVA